MAWINASAAPTSAAEAHDSLGKVLSYAHAAIVKDACAAIPVTRQMVDQGGIVSDRAVRSQILDALVTLVAHSACG